MLQELIRSKDYGPIIEIIDLLRTAIGLEPNCLTISQSKLLEAIFVQKDGKITSIFSEIERGFTRQRSSDKVLSADQSPSKRQKPESDR